MIKCILIDDEPLARGHLKSCIEKVPFLKLEGVFDNTLAAWDFMVNRQDIELVFSDIMMPDVSGVDFLKSLNNPPMFIFATGTLAHAVESFELNVVDYILKPFDYVRLLKAANKARALRSFLNGNKSKDDILVIKDGHRNIVLKHNDIFYLKANGEYVEIETADKKYTVEKSLKSFETDLPNKFVRVHKSYIINADFVEELTPKWVVMQGGIDDIPIGLHYKAALYKRFGIG